MQDLHLIVLIDERLKRIRATMFNKDLPFFCLAVQPNRPFLSISGSHWPIHDLENVTLVCHGLSRLLPQEQALRYSYFWSINRTRYDPVKEQLPAGHQVPANSKGNELVVTDVMMTNDGRVCSCLTSEEGSNVSVAREQHRHAVRLKGHGENDFERRKDDGIGRVTQSWLVINICFILFQFYWLLLA